MKSTNEQKPAGKVKGAPVEAEKEIKKVRKQFELNREPETLFTVSGSRAFGELRKSKDSRTMAKVFKALSEDILSELKDGLESDMGCALLLTLYKNEFGLIRTRLEAVKNKFNALTELLNGEDIVGGCKVNGIIVNLTAPKKIVADIDGMSAYFTSGAASLSALLKIKKQDVLNYKTTIAYYEALSDSMTGALPRAKDLLDAIRTVRNLQEAQSLYLDVAKEGEINDVLSGALKEVKEFFELFGQPVWTEEDERGGVKLNALRYYSGDFNEEYKDLEPALEGLRKYAENFNTDCIERRNRDIERLKTLADRVCPAVPHVGDKVYELVLLDDASKAKYSGKVINGAIKTDKLATLTLADVLQAHERGGSDDALFSLSALKKLNMVTADTERVLIVDGGYPMREDWKDLRNKMLLIGKGESVYLSESAADMILQKD